MPEDWEIVAVRYVGGPLDGEVNELDHTEGELREDLDLGRAWDFTPGAIHGNPAADVIERYQLENRDGRWFYVHAGTFERPVLERNFVAVFVGGPRDGQTATFLATIRDRLPHATSLFPGYELRHHGDDPLEGWKMHHRPNLGR